MLKAMSKTMHPQHVMLLTEQQSGMRFCKACNKLLVNHSVKYTTIGPTMGWFNTI